MPSLTQIRTALKTTIQDAIPGLTGYRTTPEQANLPAFVIIPRATNFMVAMGRGADTYDLDVIVLISRRDDGLAQDDLDEYVNGFGDKSIRQAVWNNRTLGLDECEATVVGLSDYGARFSISDIDHVGARLLVRVMTSGKA